MATTDSHVLIFDGICNLCNSTVKFIIKRDPKEKFKFATLQSDSGKEFLKKHKLETLNSDTVILIVGDQYYIKSSAALRVLKELGGFWKLWYFFIYLPRPIRDFIYNLIAKSRYTIFGKMNTCMIPSKEIMQRFL